MTSQFLLVCLWPGAFRLSLILVGQSCRFALVVVPAIGQAKNIALLFLWKFGRRGSNALPEEPERWALPRRSFQAKAGPTRQAGFLNGNLR
jgi:hypothetical protein